MDKMFTINWQFHIWDTYFSDFLESISAQCRRYQTFIDSQFDQFQVEDETQRTGLKPKSSHLTANSLELIKDDQQDEDICLKLKNIFV